MRRSVKWSAVLVCSAVLGVTVLWLLSLRPGITRGNVQRLTRGAGEADVEALLGGPAGIYTSDGRDWAAAVRGLSMNPAHTRKLWVADDGAALVDFDGDGLVVYSAWIPQRQTSWDVFRRWLGL